MILKYIKLLANVAINFNLHPYTSAADKRVALAVHVEKSCPERYEIAVKLAIANIAEMGFHEVGDEGRPGPYRVVNDALENWVLHGGPGDRTEDIDFDLYTPSARAMMHELLWRADCGSDAHLQDLNTFTRTRLCTRQRVVGPRLYSTLRVLPLGIAEVGSTNPGSALALEEDASGERWRAAHEWVPLAED